MILNDIQNNLYSSLYHSCAIMRKSFFIPPKKTQNSEMERLSTVYPPDKAPRLTATYYHQSGNEVVTKRYAKR